MLSEGRRGSSLPSCVAPELVKVQGEVGAAQWMECQPGGQTLRGAPTDNGEETAAVRHEPQQGHTATPTHGILHSPETWGLIGNSCLDSEHRLFRDFCNQAGGSLLCFCFIIQIILERPQFPISPSCSIQEKRILGILFSSPEIIQF